MSENLITEAIWTDGKTANTFEGFLDRILAECQEGRPATHCGKCGAKLPNHNVQCPKLGISS